MKYGEYVYFSINHDCEMVRLSVNDAHQREYFCLIPYHAGRAHREQSARAKEALAHAIETGQAPGEVTLKEVQYELG